MSRFGSFRMTEKQVQQHQARIHTQATGRVERTSDGRTVVNLPTLTKAPKYRNRKCVVDGEKFDSQKEANRWRELKLLEYAGEIKNLRRQVRFQLAVRQFPICAYFADFVYVKDGHTVVEDVKGYKHGIAYQLFKIKAALMAALHHHKVIET